jgi:hypothetical protein
MDVRKLAAVLLALFALNLAACVGGGDDEDDEDAEDSGSWVPQIAPIAGVWSGSITATGSGTSSNAVMLADESGDMILRISVPGTAGYTIRGDACCETSGSGTADLYQSGVVGSTPIKVSAAIQGNTVTGNFTLNGTAYSFNLTRSNIYTQPTSFQAIAGTYTRQLALGYTQTMTISSTGEIIGSDTYGCVYNGQLSLPRPDRTLFRVTSLTVSSCAGPNTLHNGSYTGLATLSPQVAGGPLDVFLYYVTGPTAIVPVGLIRS